MSSIVYLKNKDTGKVYAYLNESKWDPVKKKCVCKRKCLGHLDPETGDILPNRGKKEKDYAVVSTVGTTFFLEQIAERIGLRNAVRSALPDDWRLALSCAFYLLEGHSVLQGIRYWSVDHQTPYGRPIEEKDVERLLSTIDENTLFAFYREWRDEFHGSDFYIVNTESVSSYSSRSERISFNDLPDMTISPTVNINMVLSMKDDMPLAYSVIPRSPRDLTDIRRRESEYRWLDLPRITHVLDKDFCSSDNFDSLTRTNQRFLIRTPPEFPLARESIIRVKDRIMDLANYRTIEGKSFFVMSFLNYWKGRKCYVHIYFSTEDAENEFSLFLGLLEECRLELENGVYVPEHRDYYDKYFIITETPGGRTVVQNGEAIMAYNDVAGFFVLISNTVKDPLRAFGYYLRKDGMEARFENIRNRRDRTALKLYTDQNLYGRVFLQFLAVTMHSHITNVMDDHAMLKGTGYRDILHEMSAIKKVSIPGFKTPFYTNINNALLEVMKAFGVDPSSLRS